MLLQPGAPTRTRRVTPPIPMLPAAVVCAALAGLWFLAPSAPTTDPWGWINWGREITHLDLDTSIGGTPSWKPLPVIFTTLFSLTGAAAPTVWLFFARAAGLLSLVFAYRLGARLRGPVAGVAAALAFGFTLDVVRELAHGYAEPMAAALLFAAIESHLDGREGRAFGLGTVAALVRPEVWPLVLIYGAVRLWRPGRRLLVILGAAAVPALWLIPDWIGSGDPFHGNHVAHISTPGGPSHTWPALGNLVRVVGPATLTLAAAAIALAIRRRDRVTLALGAWALLWGGALVIAMLLGYSASERYLFLPATLLCIVAGVGAAEVVASFWTPRGRLAGGLVLLALAMPFLVVRGAELVREFRGAEARAELQRDMIHTAQRLGRGRALRLGLPTLPAGLGWNRGALAWQLHVHIGRIRGARTSATGLIAGLSGDRGFAAPPPGSPVLVSFRHRRRPPLLFAPFGSARLRVPGHPAWRLLPIEASGRWRAYLRRIERARPHSPRHR